MFALQPGRHTILWTCILSFANVEDMLQSFISDDANSDPSQHMARNSMKSMFTPKVSMQDTCSWSNCDCIRLTITETREVQSI